MKKLVYGLFLPLLITIPFNCKAVNPNPVFIRTNQVGFLPEEIKTAVVFSGHPLFNPEFKIKTDDENVVLTKKITDSLYTYDKFQHCYLIDFTELQQPGRYFIEVDGNRSFPFLIGNEIYNNVVDSLALFFRVQRCGPTKPILHGTCHLSDVARIAGYEIDYPIDVTGGWHDAGDYIKFLSTAAYTTYLLIFSYEFDPVKFGFDNDGNGVPDILEEARVGLDWLLRCNFVPDSFITQVQDLRDHEVGWRLPEYDTLRYDRVGHIGISKNQIGMFAAAMSIGARVWKNRFYDEEFAARCLNAAEHLYSIRKNVPDIDMSPSGFYQDNEFLGKLALGAVELYHTTGRRDYIEQAMEYADSAGSDYWWSWGNINSLAHYRIAKSEPRFADYIKNNLNHFSEIMYNSPFRNGTVFTWGTTKSILGVALQALLYKDLTNSNQFDSLEIFQRDYILGRNPWGLSFIYNIGSEFPQNLHSQVAYFNGGYLPGAVTAGPAPLELLEQFNIERENFKYDYFNTDSISYFDDRMDYVTNEPTIGTNATALFVFGYYSDRLK